MEGIKLIKKKVRLILVVVILTMLLGLGITSFQTVNAANQENVITVTVNEGDTLWGIAKKYNTSNKDIRKVVYEIEKANNIKKCIIYPGQQLKVPIE